MAEELLVGAVGRQRNVLLVPRPTADISELASAHARLHRTIEGVDDSLVKRPSGLPRWTVGHVLTHLARNADSVVRRLEGAARGQKVEQYPGGLEERAAAIERGATRPASSIVGDVVASDDRLEEAMSTVASETWAQEVAAGSGGSIAASDLVFARWREVEIHHVDLGLGYSVDDWSESFVERMLPRVLRGLPGRCDTRILLGWSLGRTSAPDLTPWG